MKYRSELNPWSNESRAPKQSNSDCQSFQNDEGEHSENIEIHFGNGELHVDDIDIIKSEPTLGNSALKRKKSREALL